MRIENPQDCFRRYVAMTQGETLQQLMKSIDEVFGTRAKLETFLQEMSGRCPPGVALSRCFESALLVIQSSSPPVGRGIGQPCPSYGSLLQKERDEAERHYKEKLTEAGQKFPDIKKKFERQFA
jgi:hypothetical protein